MAGASRADFERRVRELSARHRGSATEHEAQAASYLESEIRALGLEPTRQPFTGCRSFGARLVTHVVVAAIGAALLWTVPAASVALAALALVSLLAEESAFPPILGRLFVSAPSANVEARIAPASGPPRSRIVVLAHYDTQRTGMMWDEGLTRRLGPLLAASPGSTKAPMFPVMLAMLAQIGAGAAILAGWLERRGTTTAAAVILSVYAIATIVLADWARGPFVPGANDNATGSAAVLALLDEWRAAPREGVELVALWTGCEETGLIGAASWTRAHERELQAVPTTFLNIDTLGRGRPRFLGGEYSIAGWPIRYPRPVVELCTRAAAKAGCIDAGPKTIAVASDGLALLVRGVPGATVMCFEDDGHMPACHQLIDTADRIDFDTAWRGVELATAILDGMAETRREAAREPGSHASA